MRSPQCPQVRLELGAYVLGALDAADERRVREHLDRCVECATEAASLREAGSLLSLTDLTMVEQPPEPSSEMLPNLLRRVAAARRRRRITAAVAAAAAAAVVTVAGVALVETADDPPGEEVEAGTAEPDPTLTASANEDGVAVEVAAWRRGWGAAVTVSISGVPSGYGCALVAVGANGERETAATWVVPSAGYDGGALTMDGAQGLHPEEVERYEVVTSDGELLVTLPLDN